MPYSDHGYKYITVSGGPDMPPGINISYSFNVSSASNVLYVRSELRHAKKRTCQTFAISGVFKMKKLNKSFNIKAGDTVYIRGPSGFITDTATEVLPGGIVKLQNCKVDFYLSGLPVGAGKRISHRIIDVYKQKQRPKAPAGNWLEELRAGDPVIIALSNNKKILSTVDHITPAGKIKVKQNMELFYNDGTAVHRGRQSAVLEPATPEAVEIIRRQQAREAALNIIKKINFESLEVEKLIEIKKILESKNTT